MAKRNITVQSLRGADISDENKFKREAAPPVSLFFIVFISRLLVGFTASSAVLGTEYSADIAISIAAAAVAALCLSCAVIKMLEKGKNVVDNAVLRRLYGLFYLFSGALSISKFALFPLPNCIRRQAPFAWCVYDCRLHLCRIARI